MNSNELASLLAKTHSSHQTTSVRDAQLQPQHSTPQLLSPRQTFQSRVRNLNQSTFSKANSLSPTRPTVELDRRSSLHVQPAPPTTDTTPSLPPRNPRRQGLRSSQEPDFILEERAAWKGTRSNVASSHDDDFILVPPSDDELSPTHKSLIPKPLVVKPLVPFGPSARSDGPIQRPKTSRGRAPSKSAPPEDAKTPLRPSKFVEGSMNGRSVGVSSTWQDHGERLSFEASEDDSDATPKASRPSIDSLNSTDMAEFQPQATTPATIKQRLSKFASNFKSNDESEKGKQTEQKQPKRKGLRKSISRWSLHNLGDKVKFFGASTSDVSSKAPEEPLDPLTERKRKAEEIYEQSYSTKKQRANDGHAIEDANRTIRGTSRTVKKRSVSAQRTITPATRRRRDAQPPAVVPLMDPADVEEEEDIDHLKRPSRRELEKENQQLRALLREQKAQSQANLHLAASRSSHHLPLQDGTGNQQTQSGRARRVTRSQLPPGIPPVPALPDRVVLANLDNKNVEASVSPKRMTVRDTGTIKRIGAIGGANLSGGSDENSIPNDSREEWQWPDDVF